MYYSGPHPGGVPGVGETGAWAYLDPGGSGSYPGQPVLPGPVLPGPVLPGPVLPGPVLPGPTCCHWPHQYETGEYGGRYRICSFVAGLEEQTSDKRG